MGKTTIVSLMERFYDVEKGAITIGGYDVRDVTLSSLRKQMSLVLQDVFLFNGTIAENIAYGVNLSLIHIFSRVNAPFSAPSMPGFRFETR